MEIKDRVAKNTYVKSAWAMRKIVNFVDKSFLSTPLLEEPKIFLTERRNSLYLKSGGSLMGATGRLATAKLILAQRYSRNLFTWRGELELEIKCPSQCG